MKPIIVKKINLRNSYRIQTTDTEEHSLDLEALKKEMSIVFENKLLILTNAIQVENQLQDIITFYFFGRGEEIKEKRETFSNQIMKSSWCAFSAKRSLVAHLASSVLDNKNKNEYDRLLSKVIGYRNAFAHGQLTTLTDGTVKLSWFEGSNREQFLNDVYLDTIEEHFKTCFEILDKISYKLGMRNPTYYTVTIYREKFNDNFPIKFWYEERMNQCSVGFNNGRGLEPKEISSTEELLDFIYAVAKKLWSDAQWQHLRREIAESIQAGSRHFSIDSTNKVSDHY